MNKEKIVACLFLASALFGSHSQPVHAEIVIGVTLPTSNYIFGDFGGGDYIFSFATPINDCVGAWIAPTQPGAKVAIAVVTASQVAQRTLNVYVDRASVWAGSVSKICKLYAVGFQ